MSEAIDRVLCGDIFWHGLPCPEHGSHNNKPYKEASKPMTDKPAAPQPDFNTAIHLLRRYSAADAFHKDGCDELTQETEDFLERLDAAPQPSDPYAKLEALRDKLREQAHEMESPYFTHEPEQPDWDYVAKAFKEIADEISAIAELRAGEGRQ